MLAWLSLETTDWRCGERVVFAPGKRRCVSSTRQKEQQQKKISSWVSICKIHCSCGSSCSTKTGQIEFEMKLKKKLPIACRDGGNPWGWLPISCSVFFLTALIEVKKETGTALWPAYCIPGCCSAANALPHTKKCHDDTNSSLHWCWMWNISRRHQ